MPSRTGFRTSPLSRPRSGATTAPAQAPWASAAGDARPGQQGASAAAEFLRQQLEVSGAVELPASEVAAESGAMPESEAADRSPQASRYSGSLFRQPRLLTSCPNSWSVGVVQNTPQKQGIQTHTARPVNGPFRRPDL